MGFFRRAVHARIVSGRHAHANFLPTNTASRPCIHHGHTTPLSVAALQVRGAKTVSKRKVKDLAQGALPANPLPAHESDDIPRYSNVLQGVRNNMIKFNHCVVLTRVGNFYELYFEHAEEFAPLLGLKLASKATALGPVAMAGFPYWQLDRFLKALVQDLKRYVAISEEFPVTNPERMKLGGLQYDRKVARVVTPGTLIDESFLDPLQNNFLLAIHLDDGGVRESSLQLSESSAIVEKRVGLAWVDLSTGDFFTQTIPYASLSSILARIGPQEIVLPHDLPDPVRDEIRGIVSHSNTLTTLHQTHSQFTKITDWSPMLETPIAESDDERFTMPEKMAAHRMLDYVHMRLQDVRLHLRPPRRKDTCDILSIDRGSLRGLEILETAKDGFGKGSLFHAVRGTVTAGGSRLLRERLTAPSTSLHEINSRLALVTRFYESEYYREGVVRCLKRLPDVNRLVQRFAVNKGNADDMLSLARAISEISNIYDWLDAEVQAGYGSQPDPLRLILEAFNLSGPRALSKLILNTIDEEGLNEQHRMEENDDQEVANLVQEAVMRTAPEELPMFQRKTRPRPRTSSARAHFEENQEPWMIRRNARESLERLHTDLEALNAERAALEERLHNEFNTSKLELKWTPALGHICHITSSKSIDEKVFSALNCRVISASKSTRSLHLPEWSRLGERLAQARLNIRHEESQVFSQLRQQIIDNLVLLRRNAVIIDELDVAISFAQLAHDQDWSRPKLNNSLNHSIVAGRHPTVKLGLEEQGRTFVSNDLFLNEQERVWIVTGPNMAGKSTFLRQNALITILAQTGSYVPAQYAELGIVDQIFSRIGAADDLFRDQSTFMVEMLETAAILKHATPRSFVIMDEVGRGTTPEDGTAVSFACLHHLYHINKPRTLFATHFHALADMTRDWTGVGRYCTDVHEDQSGSFTFIHKLSPGVNRQSHALKVAQMAGLPESALSMARLVQKSLKESRNAASSS